MTEVDGVRLIHDETLRGACREMSSGFDEVMLSPNRWASGFMLDTPYMPLTSESSFGHHGAGGSLGFGDRDVGVAFGYVPNLLASLAGESRTEDLIETLRTVLAD